MQAHRDLPIAKHGISGFFRPVILLRDVRKANVNNNHLAPAPARGERPGHLPANHTSPYHCRAAQAQYDPKGNNTVARQVIHPRDEIMPWMWCGLPWRSKINPGLTSTVPVTTALARSPFCITVNRMWHCPNCGEQIDDVFDACWKCGTAQDGTLAADFQAKCRDSDTPDSQFAPGQPTEAADDSIAAPDDAKQGRIVELRSAANAIEAYAIQDLLEEPGIPSRVVGEFLGSAAGSLPLGETTAPGIWVREETPHAPERSSTNG